MADDSSRERKGEGASARKSPLVQHRERYIRIWTAIKEAEEHCDPASLTCLPFPESKRRDVVVVINTPDQRVVVKTSKKEVKQASRVAFGRDMVRKVVEASEGIWLVRLKTIEDAHQAVGSKVKIGDHEFISEARFRRPSRMFAWEASRLPPSVDDVAGRLRDAFGHRGEGVPDVYVQHTATQDDGPKGRVVVSHVDGAGLLRFYLQFSGGLARFDPLHAVESCSTCGVDSVGPCLEHMAKKVA